MTYKKFLFNQLKTSKAYPIMSLIVLISMTLMMMFGPTLNPSPVKNVLLWAVYMFVPLITNTVGGLYLQYKKQENNPLAILAMLAISYVILFMLILLFDDISTWNAFAIALRTSLIIYVIVAFFATIIVLQILKVEALVHIEKKFCPDILKTIPLPKRGDLWGLQANDHYVNIITSKGNHMVYSSLANAIDESTPIDGVRVHRSYWIAQDGLQDITRKNNRYVCVLKNGMEISVSRKGVEAMKKLEWIK